MSHGRDWSDPVFFAGQYTAHSFPRGHSVIRCGYIRKRMPGGEPVREGVFSVRRNVHAPFLATSNYAQVKVLGTEFEVDESRQDTATRVYVKSGKVVFKARYGKDGIILTKDMCGMLAHGDEMPVVSRPAFPNPSAWATGKFIYRNTPIEEVLKELSLYYGTPLYSSAHYRTITGEFKTDNLEEIIALIEKTLDIKITKKSR